MAFDNFSHVAIICGNEYIALQRDKIIQCSHLRGVILEEHKVRGLQKRLLPNLSRYSQTTDE